MAAGQASPEVQSIPGESSADAAYNNRGHVSDWPAILARWARDSEHLYKTRTVYRDLTYGSHPRNTLDFFPAAVPGGPTMFYVHGGYWQWLTKEEEAFVARGALDMGINVALCEYRLCPDVGFDHVVADVNMAFAWLIEHLPDYGGRRDQVVVAGSSAGAHLAATLLNHPAVRGALLISGIYDLRPLMPLRLNSALALDEATARRNSPALNIPSSAATICVAVGADELPAFIHQSRDYLQAWHEKGQPGWGETIAGTNHFTVLDQLSEPGGILARCLMRLCAFAAT